MEIELTHTIPVSAFSNNAVEFIEAKTKCIEGKEMVNEITIVVPQYIIEHTMMQQKSPLDLPKPINVKPTMIYYFSYYGEFKCTKEVYENWANANRPKK
jgi:hypothetical protein